MRKDRQNMGDDELAQRLERLRKINRDYDEGRINWEDRVRMHNEVVPGIGDLADSRKAPKGRSA